MKPETTSMPEPRQWQMLQAQALEPAASATHAFVQAARQHLPAHERPHLHVVAEGSGTPACIAALKHERWRWPPLGRIASSRWGDFFFLGLPLLGREQPRQALRDLLDSVRHAGMAALELRTIPANGPFMQALHKALAESKHQPFELARWQRAVLDASRTPDEWWQQDIGKKRRKEWTRLKRKLAEQGQLAFESLPATASARDLDAWLDDFLQLEASGWKGRNGTALLCSPHNTAFVRAMTMGFHTSGDLRFWRLRLDGRTIAALFGMISGSTLWLGKIAYDETMHHYSPGVLLTIEATRTILADPAITFADSSADPNHPMIDHIWKQRLELVDVLVPVPGISRWRFQALARTEQAYRHMRQAAKHVVNRWRQRHRRKRHARPAAASSTQAKK